MWNQLQTAVRILAVMTLLAGGAYPLVVTGIAQIVFPHQANGSLIMVGGRAVGSELIGQTFTQPKYFWGRRSATAPTSYNAAASSGSNWGPLHPDLEQAAAARLAELRAASNSTQPVPVDLVTASASGLDPHISPAAAEFQIARVARARGWTEEDVRILIRHHTSPPQLGVLGEARVNVVTLNRALDTQASDQESLSRLRPTSD